MKIFGYANKRAEIVITIFNKKYVIKKNNSVYRSILSNWNQNGITEELTSALKLLYFNSDFWNDLNKEIWLIYICCLLKNKDKKTALKVLFRYVELFGIVDIEKFLPAAKFAYINGIESESIKDASDLFDLFESKSNHSWLDYLENKTVAIVGNGSHLIGAKKGKEIDAHDIVIRFNQFRTAGFEEDCGKKTNIWVTQILPKENFSVENLDFIVLNAYYSYWNNMIDIQFVRKMISNNKNINILELDDIKFSRDCLQNDFYNPTTGASLILAIYRRFKNFNNIDFYGFGFLNDKFAPLDHYYKKVSKRHQQKAQSFHSFQQESCFLKQLIQGKSFNN